MKYNHLEFLVFVNSAMEEKLYSFPYRNWILICLKTLGIQSTTKRIICTCLINFSNSHQWILSICYIISIRYPDWTKLLHLKNQYVKHSSLRSQTYLPSSLLNYFHYNSLTSLGLPVHWHHCLLALDSLPILQSLINRLSNLSIIYIPLSLLMGSLHGTQLVKPHW